MTACIIGWAHSRFGKLEGEDIESLIVKVGTDAIRDAGLAPSDIDEIYLGTFNGGFVRQEFPSSLTLQIDPSLRYKPATRVENACATGSAAIYQGLNAIAAKRARRVLVVGVEKMTEVAGPQVGDLLIRAAYLKEEGGIEGGFAGVFGRIAQAYFQRYGDKSDALAKIAAKNHKNGAVQPAGPDPQGFGLRFLPHGFGQEPDRGGAAAAHRLLAGLRRRRGAGADRYRHRARLQKGGGVPRRRAGQRLSAHEQARHHRLTRGRKWPGGAPSPAPAWGSTICPAPRSMIASPSPS